MVEDEIIFNGISSKDVGIHVETYPDYVAPQREYQTVEIPGRHGKYLLSSGVFPNVERSYQISFGDEYKTVENKQRTVASWLMSPDGYARLEDAYEPGYFRMAVFQGPLEIANIYNHGGRATITFDCLPQRYLTVGENAHTIQNLYAHDINNEQELNSIEGCERVERHKTYTYDHKVWEWVSDEKNSSEIQSVKNGFPVHDDDLIPKLNDILCGKDYEKSGLRLVPYQIVLNNPTEFESKPLIKLIHSTWSYMPGTIDTYPIVYICFDHLNSGEKIAMKFNIKYLVGGNDLWIDCEDETVYANITDNRLPYPNNVVEENRVELLEKIFDPVTNNEVSHFPTLKAGTTVVRLFIDQYERKKWADGSLIADDKIEEVRIYPRWWTV